MSQSLTLHPVLRNDDNLEIAVMKREGNGETSWTSLVFTATDDGIVMTIRKQKHVDILIGDDVMIPTVFDPDHNVLLSQALVDQERKDVAEYLERRAADKAIVERVLIKRGEAPIEQE